MDKKTISAIFLILMVLMAYQLVILPRVAPPPAPEGSGEPADVSVPVTTPAPAVPQPVASGPETPAPAWDLEPPAEGAAERETISIERPLYRAELDSLRGGLRSWRLDKFVYSEKAPQAAGEQVELLLPNGGIGALGLVFTDSLSRASFTEPFSVEESEDGLLLRGLDEAGLLVQRRYRFNPESYDVEMEIAMENRGEQPRTLSWELLVGPGLDRYHQKSGGPDMAQAVAYAAGEIDTIKVKKAGQYQALGPVTWVGIGDRYFLSALSSSEGSLSGIVRKNSDSELLAGLQSGDITLMPRQVVSYNLTAYFGPKDQGLLSAYGLGFEKSVNYGWFSWLALPFLSILKFFYSYLNNWGFAILALTMVVKLALFPITQNMYRSMRKMQSLQPQIAALKKKFKDDSKALQQETMKLYKEYKVNPMAGCLPMVIQIPVFFALYRVLYNAIELRGASFLYIPDLSLKDPYYITPLLMGATMILQQRMSPTSIDPKQARMMMFMPIIFTAMFLNFSSGLVLYFLFSNVFAIGEQQLVKRWSSRKAAAPAQPQEMVVKKSGKRKKR